MRQKGFTLIEVIGVIAIIAVLGLITVPLIVNVLNNNSNSLDETQKKLIISAAKSYASKNVFQIDDYDCINVSQLVEQGYLDNLSSENTNYNNYKVEIEKVGGKYQYNLLDGTCDGD